MYQGQGSLIHTNVICEIQRFCGNATDLFKSSFSRNSSTCHMFSIIFDEMWCVLFRALVRRNNMLICSTISRQSKYDFWAFVEFRRSNHVVWCTKSQPLMLLLYRHYTYEHIYAHLYVYAYSHRAYEPIFNCTPIRHCQGQSLTYQQFQTDAFTEKSVEKKQQREESLCETAEIGWYIYSVCLHICTHT